MAAPDKLSSKIILHIDDDQDDHYLLQHATKIVEPSIIIKEAKDGKKAMDFLTQAKLFGDLPSLIILDMNMPVMDGVETFKQIKRDPILSAIPIVIFTTSLNEEASSYWKKENIPAFTKPANLDEFTKCVGKILGYTTNKN